MRTNKFNESFENKIDYIEIGDDIISYIETKLCDIADSLTEDEFNEFVEWLCHYTYRVWDFVDYDFYIS